MKSASQVIRDAALFKTPRRRAGLIGRWLGGLSNAFDFVFDRSTGNDGADLQGFMAASMDERRMFLLFCALELAGIEQANAAAYHGDIDGDFDY